MSAYSDFAGVYDIFMDETPYEEWCRYIEESFRMHGIPKGLVLDLGCGTGVLTRMLRDKGYDMIGVDLSEDMLNVAIEAEYGDDCDDTMYGENCDMSDEYSVDEMNDDSGHILYLNQDMRQFELYGTVGAIVSVCDSVNYLTQPDDVVEMFRLVNNYLDPKGIFVFDFNTKHKYRDVIGNTTIAENRDECSFIWENYYDEETCINEYDLTLYIADCTDEEGNVLYRRSDEVHLQRGYTNEEMIALAKEAGLEYVSSVDADTRGEVTPDTQRVYMVLREHGKNLSVS